MRYENAKKNLFAVSGHFRETAINTEQELDMAIMLDVGDIFSHNRRLESNVNEANGLEEPDYMYDNGSTGKMPWTFEKAQPHHLALVLSYLLGSSVATALGSGYKHVIKPLNGRLDNYRALPSLTGMQRLGDTIMKRRIASLFLNSATVSFKADSFLSLKGDLISTGKITDNITEETVSALGTATSITLAADGVAGADAAGRLDSIHRITVELTAGVYTEVAYSAVSAATPAVITITSPGGAATNFNYRIAYMPIEASYFSFPAKIQEIPLKMSESQFVIDGKWNGTAFQGGRTINAEVGGLDWKFDNKAKVNFLPGAGGNYASDCSRDGREQSITLDRKFRDYMLQNNVLQNRIFGLRATATGPKYDADNYYLFDVVWPKCQMLSDDIKVNGKLLAEAGSIQVLEDATYGSVIVTIQLMQTGFAQ